MAIERVETVILALESARNTNQEPPGKINGLISKIRTNTDLSPEEKEFINDLLIRDRIKPVFQRGVSC